MRIHLPHSLVAAAAAAVVTAFAVPAIANAEEVKSLRGKPSSDMILDALSPTTGTAAKPTVRRRGLSLNDDEAAPAEAPAAQAAAQPVAATVSAQPAAQAAPAVMPVAAAQPQRRALDLDIQFQFNSDQLTNDGKDVLDQLATALKSEKLAAAKSVVLEGHADAKGNAGYNQALSYKRAQSAKTYLATRHGITAGKLKATGKGSTEPADPANPESEVNRRVRVILEL